MWECAEMCGDALECVDMRRNVWSSPSAISRIRRCSKDDFSMPRILNSMHPRCVVRCFAVPMVLQIFLRCSAGKLFPRGEGYTSTKQQATTTTATTSNNSNTQHRVCNSDAPARVCATCIEKLLPLWCCCFLRRKKCSRYGKAPPVRTTT